MEVDRLTVKLDVDTRALTTGLRNATRQIQSFQRDMGNIGSSADRSARQSQGAFGRIGSALKSVQNMARGGINVKTQADQAPIDNLKNAISGARQEATRPIQLNVSVDQSGIDKANQSIDGLRRNVENGGTFKLDVDQSGISQVNQAIDGTRANVERPTQFKVIADLSGIEGATEAIEYVRSDAEQGTVYTVRTDFDSSDAEVGINAMRAQTASPITLKIQANADIAGAMAQMQALNGQIAATNGKRITVYGNVDQSVSQAIPAALGDLNTRLQQSQTAMALFASYSTVVKDAALAGIATAAVATGAAVGSFAITLGTGLVGAAGAGAAAMGTAGASIQLMSQFATGAVSSTLGLGKGMFNLANAAKAAQKETKAFNELVAQMPAGTEASAQAQQRLALAQQYEAGITQLQISWWGKFGGAANTLAASLNTLRLGFYEIGSVAGGMMIPTITEFVNIANSQLPNAALAAGMVVRAFNEGTTGLRAFLESAQGLHDMAAIWEGIGRAAEPTVTILGNAFIVFLQGIAPAIQYGTQLLEVLANLSVQAGNWAKSAEGTATIEAAWVSMIGVAQQLWEVVSNLGEGLLGVFTALNETGLGDAMLAGLVSLSEQFKYLMSDAGGGKQAIIDFSEAARPALEAIVPAAMQWAQAFFRVIDSVVNLKNETTGLSVLEEIVTSLGNAAGPFSEMFIHTFETLGPLLPPLIDELAEFFAFFGTTTPQMTAFLDVALGVLGWFNDLPDPAKNAAANLFAAYAVFSSFTGLDIGSLAGGIGGVVGQLLLMNRLSGIDSKLGAIAGGMDNVGTSADTAKSKVGGFRGVLAGLATFAAGAALAAIVIDVIVNLPDMAAAFESTYAEARAGGEGVSRSFVEGLNAAIDETEILSWAASIGDALDSGLRSITPVSIWDVLTGEATLEEGQAGGSPIADILVKAKEDWASLDEWLSGLAPSVSLWDVLTGEATLQEGAEGGSPVAGLLVSLQEGWASINEWMAGLAPEVSLWDVLTGDATLQEGAEGGSPAAGILVKLQEGWASITEWMAGLQPEVSLWDVLTGQNTLQEGAEGGSVVAGLLVTLQDAWTSVTEWLAGLVPEISLWDAIMGVAEAGGDLVSGVLETLQGVWDSITGWLAGLVPEVSLADAIMGGWETLQTVADTVIGILQGLWETVTSIWTSIKESVSAAMSYIWNDIIVASWEGIKTYIVETLTAVLENHVSMWQSIGQAVLDAMNYIWNDVIVATWEGIKTAIYDAMYYIWNDVIIATWEGIKTSIYDAMYYIWNDVLIATWEGIKTSIYDAMYYIWNDVIIATWEGIKTSIYDAMYYIWNDIIIATWEGIKTSIYDAMYYVWNDIIVATWEGIKTAIYDAMNYIWNDVIVATWEEIKTAIYNAMQYIWYDVIVAAWEGIKSATSSFVSEWATILGDGIKSGVNAAIGFLNLLLSGIDKVLGAIGAPTIGIQIETLATGGSTDNMARGGSRGGKGTQGAQPRHIVWNEQSNGREWWIATGDSNQKKQRSLLAGAAQDLGMGVTPMARGGKQGAGYHRSLKDRKDHSKDKSTTSWNGIRGENGSLLTQGYTPGIRGVAYTAPKYGPVTMMYYGGVIDYSQPPEIGWAPVTQDMVNDITGRFSTAANTYLGHGEQGGSTEDYTADFWSPGGQGSAIDPAVGESIKDYVLSNVDFGYMIWNGTYYTPGGSFPFPEDPHPDHVHVSLTGGAGGGGGGLINTLLTIAKGIWDSVSSQLSGMLSFGDGPLWDGLETYFGTMPGMAWDWLKSKIPSARNIGSSFVGGPENETALNIGESLAAAKGWTADQWEALKDLWGRESGWDYTAVNPESGAYGIPQALGHGDIGSDPASQIEWGLNYIAEQYGDPITANEFQLANGGYRYGGSTDALLQAGGVIGSGGRLAGIDRTLERYQPQYAAREFPDETGTTSTGTTASRTTGTLGAAGDTMTRKQKRRAKRRERRQRRRGVTTTGTTLSGTTTSTGGTGTTGTIGESISRTSGTSGMASAAPTSGRAPRGTGGGRLTSSPINQSINATGSGEFTDAQNTGQTSGGGRIRMRPRSTFRNRSSVNQRTSTSGGAAPRAGRAAGRAGSAARGTGGRLRQTGTTSQTGSNSVQRVNISRSRNTRNRRRRMAEGGVIDVPAYQTGGMVAGIGPQLSMVHGGERVLPRSLNASFESLSKSIDAWSGRATGVSTAGADRTLEARHTEDLLERIASGIERQHTEPTPVDINNMSDMQRTFITGFMAGLESDASTEVLDRKMAEGVRFASTLGGL